MPIFVHIKGIIFSLFNSANIVLINKMCEISQGNQPKHFSLFCYMRNLNKRH